MLPVEERPAFLDAACADDAQLRGQIEELLRLHEAAEREDFLETPAVRIAADGRDDAVHEPGAGERIGSYVILSALGHGGMGDVYLAVQNEPFVRKVAVKVIRRGMDTRDVLERFEMERQILAGLDHPNIARLYDGGMTEDGRPYFVMECVDGQRITDYCDTRRLGIPERLQLFQQVCHAVDHAHRNLVLHRDLKPSNILVTDDGTVKLLDFGIARLLGPDRNPLDVTLTRTAFRMMTPEYASPEQVRGVRLTTASDVYSLGVVLYELLTGRKPYRLSRRTTEEMFRVILEVDPDRPSVAVTRRDDARDEATVLASPGDGPLPAAGSATAQSLQRQLRGDLDTIVMKALRKEPEQRYASAEQLSEDVARYLTGRPVLAHRDSRTYRLKKFVRRHRVETVSAAAIALLLIGFALFSSWQARVVAAERDRAEAERVKAEEVARFLEGLFAASDPYAPVPERLDTLRVRDFLARGADRVRTELADQPLVQARMLDAVGRVYRSLGLYTEARLLLEQALETRSTRLGRQHPDVAESLTSLAVLFLDTGAYEDARHLLEEALAINTRARGAEHPQVAVDLNLLAAAFRELGRYEEAEQHHREAIQMLRRTAGDDDVRLMEFMTNFVKTMEWEGDYEAAEHYARESVRLHRAFYGEAHPQLAVALRELGLLLQRQGHYPEAEVLFREALAITEAVLGEAHPRRADLLNRLASVRWWQGDLPAADSIHRRSLVLKRTLYGNEHMEVAYGLNNLASVLRDRAAFASADSMHREALAITRRVVGEEHSAYWILLANLGLTTAARGDCPQAERLLRASIEGMRRTIPHEGIRVALNQRDLGGCLTRMGRYEEAETELLASYTTFREERGADDAFTRETAAHLVRLYTAWGKPEQAAAYRPAAPRP